MVAVDTRQGLEGIKRRKLGENLGHAQAGGGVGGRMEMHKYLPLAHDSSCMLPPPFLFKCFGLLAKSSPPPRPNAEVR
jgi:hypothetical protein